MINLSSFERLGATFYQKGNNSMLLVQTVKKNRDPRWDEKFQFIVEEPPINDKLHIEVFSTTKRMGLRQPKVCCSTLTAHLQSIYVKAILTALTNFFVIFRNLWDT